MIYKKRLLRKIVLPILNIFSFDFSITHPWVDARRIKLNSFKHKGYWYHRKSREWLTMKLFRELIDQGQNVVEVGGHIGFITLWFQYLVGSTGKVVVFEPGGNNLPYIKQNIEKIDNVTLIEKAVSDYSGEIEFFEDDLTGQNNSIVKDFEGLRKNAANSYVTHSVSNRKVPVVSLDELEEFYGFTIDFVKIDIEGGEWPALKGAEKLIRLHLPVIMVEVQKDYNKIFNFLDSIGYKLFSERGESIHSASELDSNTFCLHAEKHELQISKIFGD